MNKRFLKNIIFDLAVIYPIMALYFFNDSLKVYAENAISFLGVLLLVVGTLSIFMVESIADSIRKDGEGKRTRCHAWYEYISTAIGVIIFAMLGWYWVAVGFLLVAIISSIVDDKL